MSSRNDSREPLRQKAVASVPTWFYERNGSITEKLESVTREVPVTLYLNGREMVTLLCAGHHLDELAAGFFYADGFLRSPREISVLKVDETAGKVEITADIDISVEEKLWLKRTVTSGCGKGSLFYYSLDALVSSPVQSDIKIRPRQVFERMEDLNRLSETYKLTHGVHNTALAVADRILLFRDDIGRHNAVDMIVGHVFLNGIPLQDKLFLTTGRLTSEIVIKAAKVGLPVLISRNTATSLAIELATSLNITLIGAARGGRFTVYSGNRRIAVDSGS